MRRSLMRAVALAGSIGLAVPALWAQDPVEARALRGLSQLFVVLFIDEDAVGAGIDTTSLRTFLELELRRAGFPVLDYESGAMQGASALAFGVMMLKRDDATDPFVYTTSLELWEEVILARPPQTRIFTATTWRARKSVSSLGYRLSVRETVREDARQALDEFLNDYWKVNPRRPP